MEKRTNGEKVAEKRLPGKIRRRKDWRGKSRSPASEQAYLGPIHHNCPFNEDHDGYNGVVLVKYCVNSTQHAVTMCAKLEQRTIDFV